MLSNPTFPSFWHLSDCFLESKVTCLFSLFEPLSFVDISESDSSEAELGDLSNFLQHKTSTISVCNTKEQALKLFDKDGYNFNLS